MNTRRLVHGLCSVGFLVVVLVAIHVTAVRAAAGPFVLEPRAARSQLDTDVGGSIITHTTWTVGGSPYIVTGDVTVNAAITLTVEPGVQVRFAGNYALIVQGTLRADGTALQPIHFTSNQTSPAAGDWAMLDFRAGSENNVLRHAVVEYGGNASRAGSSCVAGAVCVNTSSFELDQSTLQHHATRGLVLVQSDAHITHNTFDDHVEEAIRLHSCNYNVGACRPTITGNTFTHNASAIAMHGPQDPVLSGNQASANDLNGFVLANCTLRGANTWYADLTYVVPDWCNLGGYGPVGLTLQPGSVVKFDGGGLALGYTAALTATGTTSQPIVFTSIHDDSVGGDTNNNGSATVPAAEDYSDVYVGGADASAHFEHAVFRYGGRRKLGSGPLVVGDYGTTLSLRNCELSDAEVGAAVWRGAHLTLEDSTAHDLSFAGVDANSVGEVWIARNAFLNAGSGVYVYAGHPTVRENLFQGNANAVEVVCTTQFGGDCAPVVSQHNEMEGAGQVGITSLYPTWATIEARHNWWGDGSGPYHPTLNPGGTGQQVSNGVIFDPWLMGFDWLAPEGTLFHDVESLRWGLFGRDPSGILVDITAHGDAAHSLGTALPAEGSLDWDTTSVPNGIYELRAAYRDGTLAVVGEAVRSVTVHNSPSLVWHGGQISADETWAAGLVHVVESTVRIGAGIQVTVAPGAVVKLAPATQILVEDGGHLWVDSTAASPTVLTALADDTAGGDTNLDGGQTVPRPGAWDGLLAEGTGQVELTGYVELRYMRVAHSGTLSADQTWSGTYLHVVTDDLVVPSGVTLTVEAGAVVKVASKKGLTVQSGGVLSAPGTVAQPIVFTSLRDDEAGGDTNGDGETTAPAPGDWLAITVDGGQATLDHVQIRYGGGSTTAGWNNSAALRAINGAQVSLTNSRIDLAFYDGVLAQGGETRLENCLVTGADRGVVAAATVDVLNCTFDDNRIGLLAHGGSLDIVNSVVAHSLQVGVDRDILPDPVVRYSDVWSASGVNYGASVGDQTGLNGNVSVDPQLRDVARGDYRPAYVSPVIDAADGTAAPATDMAGAPRYDDPRTANTGTPTGGGAYADMGAYEFVETADSDIDLVVTEVHGPLWATAGELATLSWTVTNVGSEAAVGPWHDTLALAPSWQLTPTLLVAGEVLAGQGVTLGAGDSSEMSAQVRVPGGVVGDYYWTVEANTRGEVFEGRNRDNNRARSQALVALDVPELVVDGAALAGQFAASGEAHWFRFEGTPRQDVLVSLDSAGTGGSVELYLGLGRMPTRQDFYARQREWNAPDVSVVAAGAYTETYYVLAIPHTLPQGSSDYTLQATELDFSLSEVTPSTVGNAGLVSLQLTGGRLVSGTLFSLVASDGTTTTAQRSSIVDPGRAYATFDLTGFPAGTADVLAQWGGATATAVDAVQVVAGGAGEFYAFLTGPSAVRQGRTGTWTITYGNRGSADVPLPLLKFTVPGAQEMILFDSTVNWADRVWLLALDDDALLPTLGPGYERTIAVEVLPGASGNTVDALLHYIPGEQAAADTTSFEWDDIPVPPGADPVAWQAELDSLGERLGETVGEYYGVLMADLRDLVADRLTYAYIAHVNGEWLFGRGPQGAPEYPSTVGGCTGSCSVPTAQTSSLPTVDLQSESSESDGVRQTYFAVICDVDYRLRKTPEDNYPNLIGVTKMISDVETFVHTELRIPKDQVVTKYDRLERSDDTLTKDDVIQTITSVKGKVDKDDNLVVIYQGHGERRSGTSTLFLNGGEVYPSQLQAAFDEVGAGTTYFICDSCFSGGMDAIQPTNTKLVGMLSTRRDRKSWFWKGSGGSLMFNLKYGLRQKRNLKEAFEIAHRDITKDNKGWEDIFWRQEPQLHNPHKLDLNGYPWFDSTGFRGVLKQKVEDIIKAFVHNVQAAKVQAVDPNDKIGPAGAGEADYVRADPVLAYTVRFENQASATAPAQEVVITDELDPDLDLSTLELTAIGFNDVVLQVPPGLDHFAAEAQVGSDPNPVHVRAALDVATGVISWTMASVDPATGGLPEDPWAGFLPPNDTTGRGEGYVAFRIRPHAGLPDGTVFTNQASIVFDVNAPIWTNVVTNTLDGSAPTSRVDTLPATSPPVFTVSWSGDDAGGSGIGAYDVFVSTAGGPFLAWQSAVTSTQAAFTGTVGATYGFYSVATDRASNREAAPTAAQATTEVVASDHDIYLPLVLRRAP